MSVVNKLALNFSTEKIICSYHLLSIKLFVVMCFSWFMNMEIKKIWIMFTVGTVDVMSTEYRPSIGRYFVDAPRPNIGHMSAVYQSTVGDMSVNCRWHIGQLSVAYQSYVICIGKLLADTSVKYRSSIGQLSAKCRRSVGQVSARYR